MDHSHHKRTILELICDPTKTASSKGSQCGRFGLHLSTIAVFRSALTNRTNQTTNQSATGLSNTGLKVPKKTGLSLPGQDRQEGPSLSRFLVRFVCDLKAKQTCFYCR